MTSWPSLQTDIRNAGGSWVDMEVKIDDRLITSRKPADIPAFNAAMVREFAHWISDAAVDPKAFDWAAAECERPSTLGTNSMPVGTRVAIT